MPDNKGAVPLGASSSSPSEPEVTQTMRSLIEGRVRARLQKHYMGVEFLAFDAAYGTWINNGQAIIGWAGVFTTRGILLGGPENNFSIVHLWGGIPSDTMVEQAIKSACETHRQMVSQQKAQMNGQAPPQ